MTKLKVELECFWLKTNSSGKNLSTFIGNKENTKSKAFWKSTNISKPSDCFFSR